MLNSGLRINPAWDAGCGCHRFPLKALEGERVPQEATETSGRLLHSGEINKHSEHLLQKRNGEELLAVQNSSIWPT